MFFVPSYLVSLSVNPCLVACVFVGICSQGSHNQPNAKRTARGINRGGIDNGPTLPSLSDRVISSQTMNQC